MVTDEGFELLERTSASDGSTTYTEESRPLHLPPYPSQSKRSSSCTTGASIVGRLRCFFLLLVVVVVAIAATWKLQGSNKKSTISMPFDPPTIAFAGNSMLYYNDCPRLVEILLQKLYHLPSSTVLQDSCLRGGSNLVSLWEQGNGMDGKFVDQKSDDIGAATVHDLLLHNHYNSQSSLWNFVLLQDHTQYPARESTRQTSLQALRDHYLPALLKLKQPLPPTVLFLQTFAYQEARLREKALDLGSFDEFTAALWNGYQAYQQLIVQDQRLNARIVPMGQAVQLVHNELPHVWNKLYNWDHFHPSPHATWLQACCIVAVMTGQAPPEFTEELRTSWLTKARYWQKPNPNDGNWQRLPLPTKEEAEQLRQVACRIVLGSDDVDNGGSAENTCAPRAAL